jgi:hypothetical protein
MSSPAKTQLSSLKTTALIVGTLAGSLLAGTAQAERFSGYAGVAGGFLASQRQCNGAKEGACDRVSYGHKIFGGWNVTPNVAAEINYFYFGGVNTIYDQAQNATVATDRQSGQAYTLGINWNVEILAGLTNHIRLGLARNKTVNDLTLQGGGTQHVSDYNTAPYLGLGLSLPFNSYVRMTTGYDYIIDGHLSRHLFSVGVTGEY